MFTQADPAGQQFDVVIVGSGASGGWAAKRLTEAEVNVNIGTQIFSDTIRKFGGVHFALAAYNAGDSRVLAWQREKPGLPQDEFIDDIPFPETQNYVKRILGTAEDYRYLYSSQ